MTIEGALEAPVIIRINALDCLGAGIPTSPLSYGGHLSDNDDFGR